VADVLDIPLAEHLCDDLQPGFLLGEVKESQPFAAQTLKFVGRSSWFVSASPQNSCAVGFHRSRCGHELFFGFYAARACHHDKVISADLDSVDINDGILGLGFPADELVAFLDGQNAFDLWKNSKGLKGMVSPLVSDCRNDRLQLTVDWMGSISEFLDFLGYFRNLFFSGSGFEDDYHGRIAANNTSAG